MNDELHDAAMRKLLRDAEPLGDFHFHVDASASFSDAGDEENRSAGTLSPPIMGRYRLIRELGRGGMGVVYEAEDPELRRRVAIKMLVHPADDLALRARFVREAQAAARLRHPNIAAVYEASEHAIVMQLVLGQPLSALDTAKDPRRAVTFIRDAALAVQHAHEEGIVHRDLKPQNLLVEGDRVVVTDFGLAKETGGANSLSQSGHIIGTPAYMAPEQAQGRVHAVDARTDVYGLGATLYHVLTGRPPFEDDDMARLLARIAEEAPRPLRAHRPELPRDLDRIVQRCLAKEMPRRYPSAQALADDLGRWLVGLAVQARPPSFGYRLAKFARRRRAVLAVAAIGLVGVIAGVLGAMAARARTEARIEALRLSATVSAALADAELHQRLGDPTAVESRLDAALASCRQFVDRHDGVPEAWLLLGMLQRARGRAGDAIRSFDLAVALDGSLVEARVLRGVLRAAQGPPRDAGAPAAAGTMKAGGSAAAWRDSVMADLAAAGRGPVTLREVELLVARSELEKLRGEASEARRLAEEAVRLDPLHIGARLVLSRVRLDQGRDDEAWHLAMSALDLHRGLGPAYLARAAAPTATGGASPSSALDEVSRRHSLTAAERRIQEGDRSAEAFHLRADARLSISDIEGALADFTEALKADPNDAHAWGNRALVQARRAAGLSASGKLDEALAAWSGAIEDCDHALTIEPTLAGASNNRGVCRLERERVLERLGRRSEAEGELSAALADFDAAIAREPGFAMALSNRALALRRQAEAALRRGLFEEAEARLERAVADADLVLEITPKDERARLERALLREVRALALSLSADFGRADQERRRARDELAPESR